MIRLLLSLLGTAVLLAFAPAAGASQFPWGTVCHTTATANETYSVLAAQPWRWQCADRDWSTGEAKAFVRFDLRGTPEPAAPLGFLTRLTRFERMTLSLVDRSGRVLATRNVTEADMRPATNDWQMSVALPRSPEPAEAVIVEFVGARHAGMLSDARLVTASADTPTMQRQELLIAGLCGLLFMPLILNFAFYRVLRDRFLLWHALAVVFMIVQTLVTSGLINRFATLSVASLCVLSAVSWGGGIAAAALFSADFMEPGKLMARHRKALRLTAVWIPCWTAFYLLADGPLRSWAAPLYFLSFIPVLGIFTWVMTAAKRRGSRAVNFQIAAWLPIMLVGAIRILSMLGLTGSVLELQLEQHAALGLEVIITTLGAADRFVTMRRQRDRAWAQSRRFEELAERDPLTGLFNRRGVEERFAELHADGFDTMAVIDLDNFKQVNDLHGHAKGDDVLRAAALALAPDEDTLAMRMGGEEFILLLRGKDVLARAERRRQAIALRIAAEVDGLERVVTASMGLVQHPPGGAIMCDFSVLYSHCDRLLYEAKRAGRNRTMSERLQSFGPKLRRSRAAG